MKIALTNAILAVAFLATPFQAKSQIVAVDFTATVGNILGPVPEGVSLGSVVTGQIRVDLATLPLGLGAYPQYTAYNYELGMPGFTFDINTGAQIVEFDAFGAGGPGLGSGIVMQDYPERDSLHFSIHEQGRPVGVSVVFKGMTSLVNGKRFPQDVNFSIWDEATFLYLDTSKPNVTRVLFLAHVTQASMRILPANHAPRAMIDVIAPSLLESDGTNFTVIAPDNDCVPAILDASRSSDVEGDPLEFSWFEAGQASPFASGQRTTNTFCIGQHTIVLAVSDRRATTRTSAVLEIITGAEAVERLLVIVEQATMPRQNKQPLIVLLRRAMVSFDQGRHIAGIHQLQTFQNKVVTQLTKDPALATILVAAAQDIIDAVTRR